MSEIIRYVLVDEFDTDGDTEYETLQEAIEAAQRPGNVPSAVAQRTYVYDDSSLVWTPNGADIWPPNPEEIS